jgi:hypothetical protein
LRSARRITKRSACQSSSIAQLLLSTSPDSRPISCTASNVRSVSILEAFFGPSDPDAVGAGERPPGKRRSRSPRLVVKKTRTPASGFAPSFFESGVAV